MSDQLAENSISISELDELQASEVQLTDKLLVERDDVAHSLNVGNIREVVGVELNELDPSISQGAVNTNPTVSITPKSTDASNHRRFNIDFTIPKANQIENTTVVEDTTATRKQTVTLVNTDTTKNTTLVINDGVGIDDFTVTQNNNDSGTSNISVELSDGSTKSLNIKNGKGISSITEDNNTANGATRAITVTYSDGTTSALSVKNGEGIDNVTVNQSSSAGATSTMTLTMSNGTTQTLSVKNGKDFHIEKSYASIAAMEADFANMESYDFVMIDTGSVEDIDTGKLYYKGTSQWEYVGDLSGKQGIKGDTGVGIASLSFSESQVSSGINVLTVTLTDGTTQTFNIRNGAKGDTGERGTGVFAGTDFSETGQSLYIGSTNVCDEGLKIQSVNSSQGEVFTTTYKEGDIYINTTTNNVYKAILRNTSVSTATYSILYWQLIGNLQGKSVGSITAPSTVDTSAGAGNIYTVKDTDGNAIGTFTVYNGSTYRTKQTTKWYTLLTDTEQDSSDVTFDTLGFTGTADWVGQSSGVSATLRGIAYSESLGLFIVVGYNGVILTSSNGTTWTSQTSGVSASLLGITYSDTLGLFVAVGTDGTILTSPNGTTWTSQSSGVSTYLVGITYSESLGLFVAVGEGGTILTSSNGTTWTSQTSGVSAALRGIVYSDTLGLFIVVGFNGTILTSSNGTTWTSQSSGVSTDLEGIAYSESLGLFVAVGTDGTILTSSNGTTWTSQTSGVSEYLLGITYLDTLGLFVAVGDNGTILTLSVPTFIFYLDNEDTGSKSYLLYAKNLTYGMKLKTSFAPNKSVMLKAGTDIYTSWVTPEGDILVK